MSEKTITDLSRIFYFMKEEEYGLPPLGLLNGDRWLFQRAIRTFEKDIMGDLLREAKS